MFQVKLVDSYFYTSTIALGGIVVSKEWMTITNDNLLPKAKRNRLLDVAIPAPVVVVVDDEDDDDEDELQVSNAAATLIKEHRLSKSDFDLTTGKITVLDVRKVIAAKSGE